MILDEAIETLERTVTRTPYGNPIITETTRLMVEAVKLMRQALKEIAEGKGAYSLDHLTHAENTIRDMKELATEALAKVEGSET